MATLVWSGIRETTPLLWCIWLVMLVWGAAVEDAYIALALPGTRDMTWLLAHVVSIPPDREYKVALFDL